MPPLRSVRYINTTCAQLGRPRPSGCGSELEPGPAVPVGARRQTPRLAELQLASAPPTSEPAPSAEGGAPPRHADFELIVEVYPVAHEADIKRLYLEVNKAEVVKEIDRCVIVTRPQPGLGQDRAVLQQVHAERRGNLGVGALVVTPGQIRAGDEIEPV